MWLTRLSITRPVTMLMLVLALLILGMTSRSRLPLDLYPDVEFPVVVISTAYPGTGPEEMETLVTKPVEDAVSSVAGLDDVTSSSLEGISQVVLQFELGTDLDSVSADVRSKVDAIRGMLPQEVKAPVIVKADVGAIPVITLSLSSERRTPLELRTLADDVVKDRLSQIAGVASVGVSGGDVREIRVEVDKSRLHAYGLSIRQVVAALQAENLNLPSGSVDEARRSSSVRVMGEFTDPRQILDVRIPAPGNPDLKVRDVAAVRDTVAKPDSLTRVDGSSSVTLEVYRQSDANTVTVVDAVRREMERLTGRKYDDKDDAPAAARKSSILPEDTAITVAMDQSVFIRDTLHDVNRSLIEGALLAVAIVFLFLHTLRGTFIVALAIPTSMIATFLVMDALGFTMNMMSMLGLSLSVGILVDDSIVVLENIHRHLRRGAAPREAAILGRTEIGLAAITITMVDVVVFVPIAFMGGIVGQFFREFGIVVATATLFSLFVSFTLTPMLASRWLKAHEGPVPEGDEEAGHDEKAGRFVHAWNYAYGKVDVFYRGLLAWALEHGSAAIAMGLMAMVASIAVALAQPEMPRLRARRPGLLAGATVLVGIWRLAMPARGWLGFLVRVAAFAASCFVVMQATRAANVGTPMAGALLGMVLLAAMAAAPAGRRPKGDVSPRARSAALPLAWWTAALFAVCLLVPATFQFEFMPAVDNRQVRVSIDQNVGASLELTNGTARAVEEAVLDPALYPEVKAIFTRVGGSRGGGMGAGAEDDFAQVNVELVDYQKGKNRRSDEVIRDINARFRDWPGARITAAAGGDDFGDAAKVQIEVSGPDRRRIAQVAGQVKGILEGTPGTYGVDLSSREGRPEVQMHIDRDRAAQYGVSVADVASALRTSLEGDTSVKYREAGEEYDIRVSLPEEQRSHTVQLADMVVGTTPQGRTVGLYEVVRLQPAGGPSKLERRERQRSVSVTSQLAEGVALGNIQGPINAEIAKLDTSGVTVKWAGEAEHMAESAGNLFRALALSIVLVFILMAALFESVLAPLIIMLAVPQAMSGALFALTLTGKSLNIATMIGIIMLVGLVTKNAILMVDYTNTLRRDGGLGRRQALLQAGPTRLQPILMTTLAMIFGMLPTALALSKGSEWRQPMAIAVIGGLVLSTFLTLLMVPVFYEVMDDVAERFAALKERVLRGVGV